jgi:hypothetical protein
VLTNPPSALIAGLESIVVAGAFLAFGRLLAAAASRLFGVQIDAVHKWGLATMALATYTAALMMVHIVTRGRIFSSPLATYGITIAIAILAAVVTVRNRGDRSGDPDNRGSLWLVLAIVATGLIVWGLPVFSNLPLQFTGDTRVHLSRASQLLNGGSTPTTAITGSVPNDYPWLFHALLALVARFTPGGRTMHALGPVLLLFVSGGILTLFALGRELLQSRIGGVALALFGALSGGFGFVISRSPALVGNPRNIESTNRYLGDLVAKRSYNIAFHNLAPPFPRELTYVLLFAFLLLLTLGLARASFRPLLGAGITSGLIGLTGGEAFIVSMGIAAVVVLTGAMNRIRLALSLFVPALLLWAGWVGPVLVNYVALGGFAGLSSPPVHLPPLSVVGAWGLATPFAIFGAVNLVPRARQSIHARVLLVTAGVAAGALIASSIGARLLDAGLATLGRSHRYWPLAGFAVALYGAAGASMLLERLLTRSRAAASFAAASMVAIAAASPLLASLAFIQGDPPDPLLAASLRGTPDTVLNVIAPAPGGGCHAAVVPHLSYRVTSYTGYRVVYFPGDSEQQARIRWNDVPHLVGIEQRMADNSLLTAGLASDREWNRAVDRYGVDLVVTDTKLVNAPRFRPFRKVLARGTDSDLLVVWINPQCVTERVALSGRAGSG